MWTDGILIPNLHKALLVMCNAKADLSMRKNLFILILLLCSLTSFANKDRIEKPQTYTFIFQNGDTIILKEPTDSILLNYSNDIVSHKRNLREAYLSFKTGEVLVLKTNGEHWITITVRINDKEIKVPSGTLQKIKEIHLNSIMLLWNGLYESASAAEAFHVAFDIGTTKSFNKYPNLKLYFTANSFDKADIWRQTDERTTQWSKF